MPRMSQPRVLAVALCLGALHTACTPAKVPATTSINQPQAVAFRCVYPEAVAEGADDVGQVVGVPLEGCGCTARDENGKLRQLGRVECHCSVLPTAGIELDVCRNGQDDDGDGKIDGDDPDCVETDAGKAPGEKPADGAEPLCENGVDDDGDGYVDSLDPGCVRGGSEDFSEYDVSRIQADCGGKTEKDAAGACKPKRDDRSGDFLPAPDADKSTVNTMACVPANQGTVRAYVGASGRGEVAVLDVGDTHRILDVDHSIPGVTAVFVDDLVSDVASDPDGRFVFTVNSSTGSVSVVRNDDVGVASTLELSPDPIFEATVYPAATSPRTLVDKDPRRLAWLTAPTVGKLIEIDLNALAVAPTDGERHGAPDGLIRRTIDLQAFDGAGHRIPGAIVRPGRASVDADGRWLYVADRDRTSILAVDLQNPDVQKAVSLNPTRCDDGYLVDVVDLANACGNGKDDDGDGLIDAADPECAAGLLWEGGDVPACYQVPQCENGLDDDGDGEIDHCTGRWEGPVPACANGLDDDGDGRIDRADPDCDNEADNSENGREVSTCADGLDNNGVDGADRADPRCHGAVERCDDGEDNDGDGKVDTADEDCRQKDRAIELGLPEETDGDRAAPAPLVAGAPGGRGADPCNNGIDDDGDGLIDADDPGCRLYSAARRFSFEAQPACGDGLDNDRDGRIDYPEDPDCYAASDRNEGGTSAHTGLGDLVALRYDLGAGRVGRSVYIIDATTGDLVAIDFGIDASPLVTPMQRNIGLDAAAQSMTLRQTEDAASLLLVDQNGTLQTVELVGPQVVTDTDGRPVFAHLILDEVAAKYLVDGFYVVERGKALRIDALSGFSGDVLTPAQQDALGNGESLPPLSLALPTTVAPPADDAAHAIPVWNPDDVTIDWNPRGAYDPLVTLAASRVLLESRTNTRASAAGRSNRFVGAPELHVKDATVPFDPERFPGFCVSATPDADGKLTTCQPLGRDAKGDPEADDALNARTVHLVQGNEAVRIVEDSVEALPADTFSLTYQGDIPSSKSTAGLFGGSNVGGADVRPQTQLWSMLDYDHDFCRLGIEPDDVLVVDDFVPVAPSLADLPDNCSALANATAAYGNPAEYREPLKYYVREVGAHRLVLGTWPGYAPDASVDELKARYSTQVRLDPRAEMPRAAPPPPAPDAACAAQFISYHLRAADDEWLLTGARSGLRHPWINRDGACVQHPDRAARNGRVHLGTRFRNEWFEFDFGYLAKSDDVNTGIPAASVPHQLDTHFEFTTVPGLQYNQLVSEVILPRALYWLPVDDRLYLVDTGLSTIAEFTGFNPYVDKPRLVRRYN